MKIPGISYERILSAKHRIPEANIQAEFYRRCWAKGVKVLLEITYERSRFDAVVFNGDDAIAIVEVKNYSTKRISQGYKSGVYTPKNTRQFSKYKEYGVPVVVIPGPDFINDAVEKVVTIIENLKTPKSHA